MILTTEVLRVMLYSLLLNVVDHGDPAGDSKSKKKKKTKFSIFLLLLLLLPEFGDSACVSHSTSTQPSFQIVAKHTIHCCQSQLKLETQINLQLYLQVKFVSQS